MWVYYTLARTREIRSDTARYYLSTVSTSNSRNTYIYTLGWYFVLAKKFNLEIK